MSALTLYKKHDKAALLALQERVCAEAANRAPPGGLMLYTKEASKKLADIAQAITWHMADEREAAGRRVPTDGYSGRQSKRR